MVAKDFFNAGNAGQAVAHAQVTFVRDPSSPFLDYQKRPDTLVVGWSCHTCHANGINTTHSTMAQKLENDPSLYGSRRNEVDKIWFSTLELEDAIAKDRLAYKNTMTLIIDGVATQPAETLFSIEPIIHMTGVDYPTGVQLPKLPNGDDPSGDYTYEDPVIKKIQSTCIRCHESFSGYEAFATDQNLAAIVSKRMPKNSLLSEKEISAFQSWAEIGYKKKKIALKYLKKFRMKLSLG